MYENDKNIKLDLYDGTQVVWRYMDFTKFLSLLQYKALFFCSCSSMKDMDPFEGEYPKKNLRKLQDKKQFIKLPSECSKKPWEYRKKFLENVCINCWHANNTENASMWKVYLSSNDGIAIKSTIQNIKNAFNSNNQDVVFIGNINYNDYDFNDIEMNYNAYLQDIVDLTNEEKKSNKKLSDADILNKLAKHYYPLIMSKRKEFEYGKEIRLVSPIHQKTKEKRVKNAGKFVSVDLDILIDEIIVSPSSQQWYVDLVKDVVKSYNLGNKKTYQSKIYEKFDR